MSGKHEQEKLTPRPGRCESQTFDPMAIEDPWYQWWDENGFFHAEVDPNRKPFSVMIPPPNVTGALHLGHALNNSLQDVLIRAARMRGENAMWLPGTDHAGVATQAVVERRLWEEEEKTRNDIGRDALIERIWGWKDTYEARILGQLRKIGASLDWERTQFTMSPELSHAVRVVFQQLFRDGLIYRSKRLINWSTGILTALSNDELDYKTVNGSFWTFKYPLKDREGEFIEVATTRPETMLGDTAVAVHPDPEAELNKRLEKAKQDDKTEKIEALEARIANDLPRLKRFADLIGETIMLPLVDRPIPIVGDAILADPEKGTGAVKVTPAHDPNDYACGQRNDLPMINILNPDGTLNEVTGVYEGLHGYTEGRKKVVADLDALGLLIEVKDHPHEVAHCYRTGVPIEPYLSNQWFVKMDPLVDLARKCYEDGDVEFHPKQRGKDYMRWLDSTPDWCISRQIWWGHRIPIWYCLDCNPSILLDEDNEPRGFSIPEDAHPILPETDEADATPACCPQCSGTRLVQDPDVLDTWFSSQLWPLSTLGWPNKTEDLEHFYPTSVLSTARDIIALWVARMIMMGMKFEGKTPFQHVLIHGTVQDDHGNIMSKSRGNGFDPLRVIAGGRDEIKGKYNIGNIPKHRIEHYNVSYGADSLRYGLLLLTTGHAQDLRLKVDREQRKGKKGETPEFDVTIPRFEEGRRFCNKIWQASRGLVFRQCEDYTIDTRIETIEDRWLYHRLHVAVEKISDHIEKLQVGEICEELYHLFWDEFCSWYLEIVKSRLWGSHGEESKAQAQTHLVFALNTLLKLLHPVMPFISESLWQELRDLREKAGEADLPEAVIVAPWPTLDSFPRDEEAAQLTNTLRQIAGAVNQMRAMQSGIDDRMKLPKLIISGASEELQAQLKPTLVGLSRFVNIEEIEIGEDIETSGMSATSVVDELRLTIPLEGVIDIEAEVARLEKQIGDLNKNIERAEKQLGNAKFVERAPEAVVQQARDRLQSDQQAVKVLEEQLNELKSQA
ncbi:MAG: valine--tRNA ligase [Deltaproteobacteria bacterium]|nr:valine--tRNA ligase [Deltaproteobacteria bacterium]|tara:strand:+ start:19827 stop:22865 length:3039 start_codon:yes stop_codon:yes gene_type:complete